MYATGIIDKLNSYARMFSIRIVSYFIGENRAESCMVSDFANNLVPQILHCYLYYVILNRGRRVSIAVLAHSRRCLAITSSPAFARKSRRARKFPPFLQFLSVPNSICPQGAIFCFPQNITLDTMLLRT